MLNYKERFNQLKELQNKAIATFSNYKVASILETDQGEFKGVNIEPSVLNLGVCAERNAMFSALTAGARLIKRIWLLTDSKTSFGSPCGACRQLLVDYSDKNTELVIFNLSGEYQEMKLWDLLPLMWSKNELI